MMTKKCALVITQPVGNNSMQKEKYKTEEKCKSE